MQGLCSVVLIVIRRCFDRVAYRVVLAPVLKVVWVLCGLKRGKNQGVFMRYVKRHSALDVAAKVISSSKTWPFPVCMPRLSIRAMATMPCAMREVRMAPKSMVNG